MMVITILNVATIQCTLLPNDEIQQCEINAVIKIIAVFIMQH